MDYFKTKERLDKVGCGFCLAKWTQVTMHLDKGMTHSCHHPAPHKVPLRELRENPSALHNSRFKKRKRKEMLEGKRPQECNFCWNIEDSSNSFSDRVFKSSEPWSINQLDDISKLDWRADYNPRYVEVAFSNTCNLKCAYCGPQFSSKWVEEIEKHGPYNIAGGYNDIKPLQQKDEMPYKASEHNPYLDKFWEYWPEMYKDLHTFRITGGEPLLAKDTFKVLEYIQENWEVNPNLSLAINTNLSVPKKLIDKMIEIAKDLTENNKVRELIIFTSVEAIGKQAEYSRYGLDYDYFWENIENILSELPKVTVNIMAAFNALSVFTYGELIDKVFEVKKKFYNYQRYWKEAIQLDTSYIRWPSHLSIKILTDEHKELIRHAAEKALYLGGHSVLGNTCGFTNVEIQKIKRTYDYAVGSSSFDVEKYRKEFAKFITEYDKRRDVKFADTFPELKEFYDTYKE